eukprot:5843631-Amphidinium_carterae.1
MERKQSCVMHLRLCALGVQVDVELQFIFKNSLILHESAAAPRFATPAAMAVSFAMCIRAQLSSSPHEVNV